jgi:adenine-specific DNA methylase
VLLDQRLSKARGLNPLPDEPLPYLRSIFNINLLDVTRWGDLFNSRQSLALITLQRIVRKCADVSQTSNEKDFELALISCLALAIGRQANALSSLCRWNVVGEKIEGTFARQALGIIWDFCEANPFSGATGGLEGAFEWVAKVCEENHRGLFPLGQSVQASATKSPLPNDSAKVFFSDPPYYDAVPYADLSDFFYVWLKRMLLEKHPDLFSSVLTPKEEEIVQLAERNKIYAYKTKQRYEKLMTESFAEARRVLEPGGIGCVVFAHKTTEAWEVQLQSLVEAGWIVTASWPIDTEMGSRLRAMNSAALASSVHLVCRPRENPDGSVRTDEIGDWRDVLQELPRRIHEWMPRLAEEGVVGADAIFACLGPALEIFSRYARVEKASGEAVTLKEYLEQVWAAVAKEALSLVFRGADASGFEEDARLTAMWLWTLRTGESNGNRAVSDEESEEDEHEEEGSQKAKFTGFTLEYDAARKIAQGLGAHLEDLTSLVEIKGDIARLLPVAERTRSLFGKDDAQAPIIVKKKREAQLKLGFEAELKEVEESGGWGQKGAPHLGRTVLDRVHQAMILFAAGRGEALRRFLIDEGAGQDERFWRLAQALLALYPTGSDERRWVEGVQARKKGLGF